MFDRLTRLLRPALAKDPVPEAPVALAALLVRIARADGAYTETEQHLIAAALEHLLGQGPEQAARLRAEAEKVERRIGDTVHLTRKVKDLIALDDRPAVLRVMWGIILSDDARHEEEDGLMRLITNLLGLADRESALARQAVLAERGRAAP